LDVHESGLEFTRADSGISFYLLADFSRHDKPLIETPRAKARFETIEKREIGTTEVVP
jgi:hypothetical protein